MAAQMTAYNSGPRAVGWRSQTAAYQVAAAELDGDVVVLLDVVPDVADADGISISASVSSGVAAVITGALATGGVATFDTPRNVVGAWTTTAVVTFVGTDQYGVAMSEASASGTSHTGTKAFKTVTSVTPNASITGATFGSGEKLGFARFLTRVNDIQVCKWNNVLAADASTVVAGVTTTATTTTGDVRGTVTPSAASDSAKRHHGLWPSASRLHRCRAVRGHAGVS
jgi:hypothetical protein